jgi:UDP-2,3-diacylglucosamine pyrophosphatase LpxH
MSQIPETITPSSPRRRAGKNAGKTHYRAIWISDVHLGTPGCKAEHLVDFLSQHTCDKLYLVGDIIDGWKLRTSWHWPQEHTNVVRKILTKAKRGTKVFYVTGNHDEFLRKFVGYRLDIGNVKLVNEVIHETADGRKLLVMHGDLFDVITRYHRWVALAGDALYEGTMRLNYWLNRGRALFGMRYWSLSAFAKQHVKTAVNIVSTFEDSLVHECRRRQLDGVVCGHIHHAEARAIDDVTYYNCGDWVESCTALAENESGQIEVIRWVQLDHLNQHNPSRKVTPLQRRAA